MYMQFFKAHFLDSDIQFDSLPNKKSLKFGCPHSVSEEDISFFFWLNITVFLVCVKDFPPLHSLACMSSSYKLCYC